MAKKAKFRVRGYFKDLMGWFKLMKRREEWIAAGDPNNVDLSDNPAVLAKELHPLVHRKGSLSTFVLKIQEYTGLYSDSVLQELEQVPKETAAGLNRFLNITFTAPLPPPKRA